MAIRGCERRDDKLSRRVRRLRGAAATPDAANLVYLGLYALQHRGQESAGIAAVRRARAAPPQGDGLRRRHLRPRRCSTSCRATPRSATCATRRPATRSLVNAQPMVAKTHRGRVALAHNGNLVNALRLRQQLETGGRDLPVHLRQRGVPAPAGALAGRDAGGGAARGSGRRLSAPTPWWCSATDGCSPRATRTASGRSCSAGSARPGSWPPRPAPST